VEAVGTLHSGRHRPPAGEVGDAAMDDATTFIDELPKAELHLHIEGTLEPELLFEIATRNDITLPYTSIADLRAAYDFRDLQDFLDLYYRGAAVLRTERDFYDLTRAYLAKAAKQRVLHTEIFFDPQAHTARGVAFSHIVDGIHRALTDGRQAYGISSRLIMCFLRHLDQEAASETLDQALGYKDRIVAVGLDSSERQHPPVKFRDVFERARREGFLTVAHAGEEGPADYVRQALDTLRVSRIDHGIRSLDDADLVARLVESKVPLTVCPLSNVKLGVVQSLESHPVLEMLRRQLMVTINSDDPAYFGGYINENYHAVQRALGLTKDHLVTIARNSFRAAFLPPPEMHTFITRLEEYVASR
jgi:adenosine deaminase